MQKGCIQTPKCKIITCAHIPAGNSKQFCKGKSAFAYLQIVRAYFKTCLQCLCFHLNVSLTQLWYEWASIVSRVETVEQFRRTSRFDTRARSISDVLPLGAVWVWVLTWEHLQDSFQSTKIRVSSTKIDIKISCQYKAWIRVGEMDWIGVQNLSRNENDEEGGHAIQNWCTMLSRRVWWA